MINSISPAHSGAADLPTCPPWCDPRFCYVNDCGARVHLEAPRQWTADGTEIQLHLVAAVDNFDPELQTYVDLRVTSLELENCDAAVWLSLDGAQRLYDQLGARLHAAHQAAAGGAS